jgi:hypothetical protein
MRRRLIAGTTIIAVALLTGCDNFQGFTVENPCPFAVTVAFAPTSVATPTGASWPYPYEIQAGGRQEITTGSGAGVSEMKVQIRAAGRKTVVETISALDDPQLWRIPESFCTSGN